MLDQQLRLAIRTKALVEVRYHGAARVVEPHDYGRHKGVDKLLVYQLRKLQTPRQGRDAGWRLLDIAKIEACRVLDETFPGSRGHQHRQHLTWDLLYARVG